MYDILKGVRVVEVSSWLFVPAAGASSADWGADVVKIEHPITGDPIRGLTDAEASGALMNPNTELPNRGKRSVGLDIGTDRGKEILHALVESADVFLTNFLPMSRKRLAIDVGDIQAAQPADRRTPSGRGRDRSERRPKMAVSISPAPGPEGARPFR